MGPDQGYVLRLANALRERVRLTEGEDWEDVRAGCCQIALRRAAEHGRAPVLQDVEVALGLWGFLSDDVPSDLLAVRKREFDVISHPHHEHRLRALDEKVAESALRLEPAEISRRLHDEWREWIHTGDEPFHAAGGVPAASERQDAHGDPEAAPSPTRAPVKKVVKKVVKRVARKTTPEAGQTT